MSAKAQDKLSVYGEAVSLNYGDFTEMNYVLDINYKITDNWSLSSWSVTTSGRQEWQGFNYSATLGLVNYKTGSLTLSSGFQANNQHYFNLKTNAFVVKARLKLL